MITTSLSTNQFICILIGFLFLNGWVYIEWNDHMNQVRTRVVLTSYDNSNSSNIIMIIT